MQRIFYSLILLFGLTSISSGQTPLSFVEQDPGITPILQSWQAENLSGWWSWAVSAWDQNNDGKTDLYFNTHSTQGGTLLLQGADLNSWSDATVALGQTKAGMPSENRPFVFDMDNDGDTDLIATGDENQKKNRRNDVSALITTNGRVNNTAPDAEVADFNGDGFLDVRAIGRSWGKTSQKTTINGYGLTPPTDVFTATSIPVTIPPGVPQHIVDELTALTLPPHSTNTSNRYSGPKYEHIDLNNDGLLDLVIQYGGSYSGGAYRFGRYLLRQQDNTYIDVTTICGLPQVGLPLLPLQDVHNNGRPDVLIGYASTTTAGLYVHNNITEKISTAKNRIVQILQPELLVKNQVVQDIAGEVTAINQELAAIAIELQNATPETQAEILARQEEAQGRKQGILARQIVAVQDVANLNTEITQQEAVHTAISVTNIQLQLKRVDALPLATTKDVWPIIYHGSASYLHVVKWLDFDKDGDKDLLVSSRRLGAVRIFENQNGNLAVVLKGSHADADGWCLVDLDNDTMLDLVTFGSANHSSVTVKFYINQAETVVVPPPTPTTRVVKINGVVQPNSNTAVLKINGEVVPLVPETEQVIELEIGPVVVPPPEPEARIKITPETIGLVETAAKGSRFILSPGLYRPILLKDREDIHIYSEPGVLFKGKYNSIYSSTVVLERCNGVHLEGFQVTGGNAGVAIYRSKFCGCKKVEAFANDNQGIFASFCSDGYVTDCHTHHQINQHGVYISNSSNNWKVTGGESNNNGRSGIQFNGDKYAGGEGLCRNNLIDDYYIHDNKIGINLDGFMDGEISNTKVIGDIRFFCIDGLRASSGNVVKNCEIRQQTLKVHGIMMRNGAVNHIENTIIALETPLIDNYYFPISVERSTGSDYTSISNTMSGRSGLPIGGGTYGKTGEALRVGDTSTYVKLN